MKDRKFSHLTKSVHIIFIIAFSLIILFANIIVYDVFRGEDESVVKKINEIIVNGKIKYGIDIIEQSAGNIKGLAYVRGWAFIEDVYMDEESQITELILASESNYYKINTFSMDRNDLPNALSIRDLNIEKSGFFVYFSEYKIKPGVYRVGLYINNDGKNQAFNWTNVYVKKEGKKLYKYLGEPVELKNIPPVSPNISFNIDKPIKSENGYITISGWSNFASEDSSKQKISVIITDSRNNIIAYPALPQINDGGTTKSNDKIGTGFVVNIPNDALKPDVYSVNIMIKNGGVSKLGNKAYKVIYMENNMYFGEDILPLEEVNPSDFVLRDTKQYKYYIDIFTFDETLDKLSVVGWLFETNIKSKADSVYAIFESQKKSYVFKAHTNERKDVTDAFKDGTNYDLSGFDIEVYRKFLEDGVYDLYLASDYDEKVKFNTGYSLNVKDDKIEVVKR